MLPYKSSPHPGPPNFLQIGVRPLQLWEIAFPEEHLIPVLNSLRGSEFRTDDNRWMQSFIGFCMKLKSILGLKDIPKTRPCPLCKKDTPRDIEVCISCEKNIGIPAFLIPNRDSAIDIKYLGIKKDHYAKIEEVCNKLNVHYHLAITDTPIFDTFYRILEG